MTHPLRKEGWASYLFDARPARLGLRVCGSVLAGALFGVLAGCASGSTAMMATALKVASSSAEPTPPSDPRFSYLRATIRGRVVYMALGYLDPSPDGEVEVWYSGSGEVVRLREGRIVGTAGLQTDWRGVRFAEEPGWAIREASAPSVKFWRERDLMPGYRAGVRDQLEQFAVKPPLDSQLTGQSPAALHWVMERTTTTPRSESLPPARFALARVGGKVQVVYSEQCLSADLCISFQRWSSKTSTETESVRAGT